MLHLQAREPNPDGFKSSVELSRHRCGTPPARRRSGRSLESKRFMNRSSFSAELLLVKVIRTMLLQLVLLIPASSQGP